MWTLQFSSQHQRKLLLIFKYKLKILDHSFELNVKQLASIDTVFLIIHQNTG